MKLVYRKRPENEVNCLVSFTTNRTLMSVTKFKPMRSTPNYVIRKPFIQDARRQTTTRDIDELCYVEVESRQVSQLCESIL